MTNSMIPSAGSMRALRAEVSRSQARFKKYQANETVAGNWEDDIWKYSGKNIHFSQMKINESEKRSVSRDSGNIIRGDVGDIFRSFTIKQIDAGRSVELINGHLISAKILHQVLGDEITRWHLANRPDYDAAYLLIKNCYDTQTSVYHRANSLNSFIRYLSSIRTLASSSVHYFLSIRTAWKHSTENPERARERARLENINGRGDKYPEELENCLGELKLKLKSMPGLEKKPETDSLLIEVMTFFLSMGLRFKEAAALPENTYIDKGKYDTCRLRVLSHKGATPSARPIPEIWGELVKSSVLHIRASCDAARMRALDIEKNGFKFVTDIATGKRALSLEQRKNILESDISVHPDDLCLFGIISDLGIGKRQTHKGGRYYEHLVRPRSTRAVQLSTFLEEVIKNIKTSDFPITFEKIMSQKSGKISAQKIGIAAGIPKGSTLNEPRLKDILLEAAEHLQKLETQEASRHAVSYEARHSTVTMLEKIIPILKSWPSSGTISLINYKTLIQQLKQDYSALLEKHFDENCTPERLDSKSFSYNISTPAFNYKLPLSEHLIVLWEDQMNQRFNVSGCLPRPMYQADLYGWLSTKAYSESVFTRFDIRKKDGEIFSISAHQIRHWLTTALLRSGPSETLVNLWMGRTSGQLRTYDHRTPKERAEFLRSQKIYEGPAPPSDWLGRKIKELRASDFSPEEINEFIEKKLSILHFTPWGYCSRDLTIMPCDRGVMCLSGFGTQSNCENFHIDPTDLEARRKIEQMRNNYEAALLALEPKYLELKEQFLQQLDDSKPLDQHLVHVAKMISGCNAALEQYGNYDAEQDALQERREKNEL